MKEMITLMESLVILSCLISYKYETLAWYNTLHKILACLCLGALTVRALS